MWKEIVAFLFFAICDAAAFSGAIHKTTSHSAGICNIYINSPSILHGSYNDDDEYEPPEKKKGFFAKFFDELDAFVDDATSRRLGNGAQYYGKRKSSFYGKDDVNRKKDKVSWYVDTWQYHSGPFSQ